MMTTSRRDNEARRILAARLSSTVSLLFLACVPLPAPACSPTLITARDALQPPGPSARFERIVYAEVIGLRAPQRPAELERWRQQVREVAAAQALQDEHEAAQAKAAAATPRGPYEPPPPPPPSRMIEPVIPLAHGQPVALDLFVLETLYGAHEGRISVPESGPCGSQPRLGQQVLVYIERTGPVHVMQHPRREGSLDLDPRYLQQVRACAQGKLGECRD